MSYSIEFYGTDPDGKPATYPISNPFLTIDAAVAEATRIGVLEPLQVTFPWKPAGYRIRDDEHEVVRIARYYGRRKQVRERGRAGGSKAFSL